MTRWLLTTRKALSPTSYSYTTRLGTTPASRWGAQCCLTSLTDHDAYPALEIVDIYNQRWELEIGFDELKTHMLKEALQSKTPDGVHQEFWGIPSTYNLVRRKMAAIASARGVSPSRVSFTRAFLLIKGFLLSADTARPGCLPKELADLGTDIGRSMILPERRSGRRYPRQVKIKKSGYRKAPPRNARGAAVADLVHSW